MTNEFVGRRFLSCFGRHCTLGHVLANVTNRENGAVSNSRPPLLELIAVEPSSLEEGDFRFSHPDCVLDTSTIGLLISFQCNDVFQHLESPAPIACGKACDGSFLSETYRSRPGILYGAATLS